MATTYRMLLANTPEALEGVVNAHLAARVGERLLALEVSTVRDSATHEDVFVANVATDDADAHQLTQPYRVRVLVHGSVQETADAFNAFAAANTGAWIGEQKLRAAEFSYPREGRQTGCIAAFAFHPVAAEGAKNWRPVPKAPGQGGPAPKAAGTKP